MSIEERKDGVLAARTRGWLAFLLGTRRSRLLVRNAVMLGTFAYLELQATGGVYQFKSGPWGTLQVYEVVRFYAVYFLLANVILWLGPFAEYFLSAPKDKMPPEKEIGLALFTVDLGIAWFLGLLAYVIPRIE